MDINNYKFETPWTAYEFANHCLDTKSELIVLSNAWLTHEFEPGSLTLSDSMIPDSYTLSYWVERFRPLVDASSGSRRYIVAVANRCGSEGNAHYAGSSTVMAIEKGQVYLYGALGRKEEGCLLVDTGLSHASFSEANR